MKTKSKSFKRKLPYDSDLECQPIGISKKQNLGPIDAFGHATVINGDNHTSKPPLATYCLHGEPSAVRDLDTREPAHSRINIDSEPVVKIPVMYITDHITKPTITITRALHIAKSLQIILILLLDDDNLMRWKEQLLRAVNINDAAGILILILATPALFIHLAPHAPIIQTRIIIDPRRVATIVSVLTPNIPALYEMHFAVPMAGFVLSKK
ncbi:hypothetical protein Tco_1036931 [Tanacetum coccineum]